MSLDVCASLIYDRLTKQNLFLDMNHVSARAIMSSIKVISVYQRLIVFIPQEISLFMKTPFFSLTLKTASALPPLLLRTTPPLLFCLPCDTQFVQSSSPDYGVLHDHVFFPIMTPPSLLKESSSPSHDVVCYVVPDSSTNPPNTASFHSSPHTFFPTCSTQVPAVDHVPYSHSLHHSPHSRLLSSIPSVSYRLQDSHLVPSSYTLPSSVFNPPVVSVTSSLTPPKFHPMQTMSKTLSMQQHSMQALLTSVESVVALLTI